MNYITIFKKFLSIIVKIFLCIMYSQIALLPAVFYDKLIEYVPLKTILLISTTALIYVNWTIWSKGIAKKIIMFFVMLVYLGAGAYFFSELAGIESDYCIEDGDCEQGYI